VCLLRPTHATLQAEEREQQRAHDALPDYDAQPELRAGVRA
jgi:hypothetical protein